MQNPFAAIGATLTVTAQLKKSIAYPPRLVNDRRHEKDPRGPENGNRAGLAGAGTLPASPG